MYKHSDIRRSDDRSTDASDNVSGAWSHFIQTGCKDAGLKPDYQTNHKAAEQQLINSNTLPDTRISMARAGDVTLDSRTRKPPHDHAPFGEQERIDRHASPQFKAEAASTAERIRAQLPDHVRDAVKNVRIEPVKSISHKREGFPINGAYNDNHMIIAEKRFGPAKLETVMKHEFGHAFDDNQPGGKPPLSTTPEFRRLVDKGAGRDPRLKEMRAGDRDTYYAEIFADLFARSINAPSRDLAVPHLDRQLPAAYDWVRRKVSRGS